MIRVLVFLPILFCGCIAPSALNAPIDLSQPGWNVRNGQAVWRRNRSAPELAGDLLVARRTDGLTLVQFTKTPFTIVDARASQAGWSANFGGKYHFGGHGKPPPRIIWLYLPDVLRDRSLAPPQWTIRSGANEPLLLENARTQERLEIFLQ